MCEDKGKIKYRGRIAPTPSGYLHEGHFSTFKVAWNRARENEGIIVYRNDDLDQQRSKEKFIQSAMRDLKVRNIDWDEGPDCGGQYGPYNQSERSGLYKDVLVRLAKSGLIYPCEKSRKEIQKAGILSKISNEFLFPENFRNGERYYSINDICWNKNWRFRAKWGENIKFYDQRLGEQSFLVGKELSDFLVWRKDGTASYELATVVDDHEMKITEVVRGEDLLLSSAKQKMIFNALNWSCPKYYHCELILDENGRKLSKSQN